MRGRVPMLIGMEAYKRDFFSAGYGAPFSGFCSYHMGVFRTPIESP